MRLSQLSVYIDQLQVDSHTLIRAEGREKRLARFLGGGQTEGCLQ